MPDWLRATKFQQGTRRPRSAGTAWVLIRVGLLCPAMAFKHWGMGAPETWLGRGAQA
jgi:hypothetical protein